MPRDTAEAVDPDGSSSRRNLIFAFELGLVLVVLFFVLFFTDFFFTIAFLCVLCLIMLVCMSLRSTDAATGPEPPREDPAAYAETHTMILFPARHGLVVPVSLPERGGGERGRGEAVVGMPLCVDDPASRRSPTKAAASAGAEDSLYNDAEAVYGSAVYLAAPQQPHEGAAGETPTVANACARPAHAQGAGENAAPDRVFSPPEMSNK